MIAHRQLMQATPSASGGLTYSKTNSSQTHGIGDINCDGLPDYYNGNFYAINNGSLFSPNYTNFSIGNMSESQSQSIGMNFSVGIGGVSGSSDLYAAKTLKSGANGTIGITYNSTTSNVVLHQDRVLSCPVGRILLKIIMKNF